MDEVFRRRHLPHWDVPGATYFVTVCLHGSIPAAGLREIKEYRDELDGRPRPPSQTEVEWERRKDKLVFAKLDEMLDNRPAVRILERREVATIVRDSIFHFANQRYRLLSYVIMPSHMHWVFQPISEWCASLPADRTPREVIMHSLKSYTGSRCNEVLHSAGQFWQQESYDHWVRDDEELARIIDYVEQNPVKAGLAATPSEYEMSSAHDRSSRRTG